MSDQTTESPTESRYGKALRATAWPLGSFVASVRARRAPEGVGAVVAEAVRRTSSIGRLRYDWIIL